MSRIDRKRARGRRWWSRRRSVDDDAVEVATDHDHAWWAARERLERVGLRRRSSPEPEPEPARPAEQFAPWWSEPSHPGEPFTDQFTTASLFHSSPPPASTATDLLDDPEPDQWLHRTTLTPRRAAEASSPWEVLGLTADAPWEAVTRRHRELAKLFHPDRHGHSDNAERAEAEVRMAEVNSSFDELGRIYRAIG